LHPAQNEHQEVLRPLGKFYITLGEKENEWQEKNDTDSATKQAVQEFQPENALERIDVHVRIYFQEFR